MSGWVAGAVVTSAVIGAAASSSAASKQAGAADRATQVSQDMFNRQTELNKPFYDTGVNALTKLANQSPYVRDTFSYQEDPGYAFRFNEGMKAVNATAAARGGLISGNALKAAARYGEDMGSQEYNNAYNRYLTDSQQKLNEYTTNTGLQQYLTNIGQSSANNQANAANNFGISSGNNMISAANANAAGMVGGANAFTSGLGTYLNYNQNQNMLAAYERRNPSSYAPNAPYGSGDFNTLGYGGNATA
jgi:hypothetical protein